jgi:hypothetical protein
MLPLSSTLPVRAFSLQETATVTPVVCWAVTLKVAEPPQLVLSALPPLSVTL